MSRVFYYLQAHKNYLKKSDPKNIPLYIYRAYKMGFFENYFHINQQMPSTSGSTEIYF